MKKRVRLMVFVLLCCLGGKAQQLVQGTLKPGGNVNEVEVWLRPNFTSSSSYLFQLVFPIAFPVSASPQPTGITFTMDPDFVTNFGTYTQTVFPMEHNTGNTENYFPISLSRVGAATQSLTTGGEFKVLTVTFNYSSGATTFQPKLGDYQDFGSGGNGGYYVSAGNGTEYLTSNSVDYFYASSGLSVVGGDASAGYVQISGSVLPVKLSGLKAYQQGGGVKVDWSTLMESNMDKFVVERSTDGTYFTAIGTVAATGNSNIKRDYSWLDQFPVMGNSYYRIQSLELDGKISYTSAVSVHISSKAVQVQVYPNPVTGDVMNVLLNNLEAGNYKMTLYNTAGQIVLRTTVQHQGGGQQIALPVKFQNGTYQLVIVNDKQYRRTLQVIINH